MDRIGILLRAVARYEARTCGACSGAGGSTVTETSDGVTRQSWRPCTACSGAGRR